VRRQCWLVGWTWMTEMTGGCKLTRANVAETARASRVEGTRIEKATRGGCGPPFFTVRWLSKGCTIDVVLAFVGVSDKRTVAEQQTVSFRRDALVIVLVSVHCVEFATTMFFYTRQGSTHFPTIRGLFPGMSMKQDNRTDKTSATTQYDVLQNMLDGRYRCCYGVRMTSDRFSIQRAPSMWSRIHPGAHYA
jgi:hypothetical protein